MSAGVSNFEMVSDRISEITPMLPKYPFAIIGISDEETETEIHEVTSPLDNYLIGTLGYSMLEMRLQAEKPNYDFKVQLPAESHKIAKEMCALANHTNGGLILVGVDDNGNLRGVLRSELDEMQRRVIDIGTRECKPSPKIECFPFDISSEMEKCVLVIHISEIEQKPCMTNEKVYIRVGTMARAANSEEIRRLLLGSLG